MLSQERFFIDDSNQFPVFDRPLYLAIGIFDGVHLGHQAVIEPAIRSAKANRGIAGVLTFDPHPTRLLNPQAPKFLLMSSDFKWDVLKSLGLDCMLVKEFSKNFSQIKSEDFLPYLKKHLPTLKAVYVGESFCFGKGRAGALDQLLSLGKSLSVDIFSAPTVHYNQTPISSTVIRDFLEQGAIEHVNLQLGYIYFTLAKIITGRKVGSSIGVPTANLLWEPELKPRFGVYVVRVRLEPEGSWVKGVANYGLRPTFELPDKRPLLEVHSLEPVNWRAGQYLRVHWEHFIRGEQKFSSKEVLKKQIQKDIQSAKAFFSKKT